MARAKRILATLRLPVPPILSRRSQALPGRSPDWRATMRDAMRHGGEIMSQYSRAVLHFVHAVANKQGQGWAQVHAFTFGTQLTNITRHMKTRDIDAALAAAGAEAQEPLRGQRRKTGKAAQGSQPVWIGSIATGRGASWGRGLLCC